MNSSEIPAGLRLSALPPVYAFTRHKDFVFSGGAVFLFQHEGEPHWFATDYYSAMLATAKIEEGVDADELFPPSVPQRCYRPEHIKALFAHVKHRSVIYDDATGNLISPDGIMIVPPYVREADAGEEPEQIEMPDVRKVLSGEAVEQSSFEFGWKFVTAIRSAFKASSKESSLTMTCLEGSRVLLDVSEPYRGQVLIALQSDQRKDEPQPEVAEAEVDQDGQP